MTRRCSGTTSARTRGRLPFPAKLQLWTARRSQRRLEVDEERRRTRYAFIGVRSCDLHAIAVQDRVFMEGAYVDATTRRGGRAPSSSRSTAPRPAPRASAPRWGPARARPRASTSRSPSCSTTAPPLPGRNRQRARRRGDRRVATRVRPTRTCAAADRVAEHRRPDGPHARRHRHPRPAVRNREHPRWDEVADRCLTCGNCTMVCPTCFCHGVDDVTDLAGRGGVARTRVGLVLHARLLLHPRRQRAHVGEVALPAVDDAQAGELDRPVRHVGLRGLRALHHLVPGGDRHHRGSRGDQGHGWRDRECGRWRLDELLVDARRSPASPRSSAS